MTKRLSLITGAVLLLWLLLGNNHSSVVVAQKSQEAERRPLVLDRAPIRTIQDPYPAFNGITMNEGTGEVILADDNRGSIMTYNAEFPPTDRIVEPRRVIMGPKTHLGYTCSVAFSPNHNELFTIDNDWKDNMSVFPVDGNGEITAKRELTIEHGAWGVVLDSERDEILMTVQNLNKISIYPRTAEGEEKPLRSIQGMKTGLADPHGIFLDMESDTIFVANHGFWRKGVDRIRARNGLPGPLPPSTGDFLPPSITVYPRDAQGDVKPLRTIQGPKTQLNLPLGIYMDSASDQLVVANSGDNSVLFFDKNADGDVAPVRVLKGPSTGVGSPSGVYVDLKRNELWVTNWRNHSATVYARTAQGDAAPLRTLRGAPMGTPSAGFGNPSSVVYDSKRKQLIVPM